ncbi:type III secretion system inner membrane ring lipoprotein SctJ [Herbaspirillum huttiense]|jgi:type III secretion protein J|uniref:type III secretion system inner membrane ring lipoprotein SctJ n=1 Tax=Herbaspirillum huttiense TaxID=863372 RepID=UPI001958A014|nr:type III secretion inner membrane ring lipoprotein SctJ [Herbaspirillum huttiense]UWE18951.1 type III secretion inner membrane ring lipoprotein SctJ [Herbaspirillum huttiense]
MRFRSLANVLSLRSPSRCSNRLLAQLPRLGAILVLLLLLSACSRSVNLQAGLSDGDANEIVLVLNRKGISVEKQKSKEGVTLIVKEDDLSRATETMNEAGLPRRSLSNLGEVFKKQGMISTPMEERIRYIHGLSEELESTLQQFDHVISARVHVVLPERIAPGEPIQPSSAAVFVKYRAPLDEDMVMPRIRKLVASSIPGLSGEEGRAKVSVVMMPGEAATAGIEWTTLGPFVVAVSSVRALGLTLLGLVLLVLLVGGWLVLLHVQRNPKLMLMIARLAMRKAKSADPSEPSATTATPTSPAPAAAAATAGKAGQGKS